MNTEVSVIIPVFNKEAYLGDCLDSVLNQSFNALEVICIDDASEDKSGDILQNFENRDARLRVIKNNENLGAGRSRNIGIEAAKGKFLRFVDADDLLPYNSIEKLHDRAIEAGADLVKGSLAIFCDDNPSVYREVISVQDKMRTQLSNEEQLWIPWWHTSYLISSDLVHKHNLRYPDLIAGEDPVFLTSVLINAEHLSFIEDIVYLYRKYQKASGSDGTTIRHATDFLKHAATTKQLLTSYNPDCWHHGYGPSLLNDMQYFLSRFEFTTPQQQYINAELTKIWRNHTFNA